MSENCAVFNGVHLAFVISQKLTESIPVND